MGSRYFVAPEVFEGKGYDSKVDIWSATIVILSLFMGKIPYVGNDNED